MDNAAKNRSTRKPKGEGHIRRGEILSAAEQIFVADGYEGATIRKIADAVGVSSTALYLHFRDKAEILSEICREAFAALHERQTHIVTEETDPVVRLRKLLRSYVDFGFNNANAYRLAFMTHSEISTEDETSMTRRIGAELYANFQRGVEEAMPRGKTSEQAKVLAQVLWSSVHGLVSIMVVKSHFDWADREVLIETQLDMLIKGVTAE